MSAALPVDTESRFNEIRIRRCVPGDEVALSLVGQASFLEAFAGVLSGTDIVAHCTKQHGAEKYRSWLSDPKSILWIAEAEPGGAPVGYLVLTVPDLPLSDVSITDLEIKRIYLLHRFQGRGVGRQLMSEARAAAERSGMRRLLLGVYRENRDAIAFYESLGYQRVGQRTFNVGHNTYNDLILGLPLSTA